MLHLVERRYSDLSRNELMQHLSFCCRALANDRSANLILSTGGRIPIWKRKYKRKSDCIELQFSSGHLGRNSVLKISHVFDKEIIEYKSRFAQKKGHLSRLTTTHDSDDKLTPSAVACIITLVYQSLDLEAKNFEIEYCGGFDDKYVLSEDDPVELTKASKIGYSIGSFLGRAVHKITQNNKT